ncbi:MAG: hypothetical protein K0R15_259 [Clostridiales bacterium]|jgi:rubrerythrin|nr:hypothetical protein [Clostridiales bacterium]
MDFQQSQTFINIQNAYEAQLKASTKYELFSIRAREEVLIEIVNIFETVSRNERFIAERLGRILTGGDTSTLQNLIQARDEEIIDREMYQSFSEVATAEGYDNIASLFNGIANIKFNHNYIFQTVAEDIQNNELLCKPEPVTWICLGCGNIMRGECAPERCPVCGYPQGYYQMARS